MYRQIEFSVTSERLAGHVSDRWKYTVQAQVLSAGLVASGSIVIDDHQLKPGTSRDLADVTRKVVLPVRPGEHPAEVLLSVQAEGVTWRDDEANSTTVTVPIHCPEAGEPAYTIETDIPLAIDDAPGFTGGEARLTVRARLVATGGPGDAAKAA